MVILFVKNAAGVHALVGDYTLCGYAHDAADDLGEDQVEGGIMRPVEPTWVSCPRCAEVIAALRPVRTKGKRK